MHVGYLLTDIEGSTERWESSPARMAAALARHDEIVDAAVAAHGGVIQDRAGDGVFSAFDAGNPIACALAIQRAVAGADWSDVGGLKVRIGVHVGAPSGASLIDRAAVNRASRICAAGWGGQIVVSAAAAAAYPLPDGATLTDLGICYLKGIPEALHLLGVSHPDLPEQNFPPLRSQFRTEGTIPVQATPIFGRTDDIAAISAALSKTRLLTVVAPGGNGKTRLAIELGKQWERETPVLFVSLRGVVGSAALASAIGDALRFPFRERSSQEAQLCAYFSDKRLLLILDNAEGLVGDAEFVTKLAASCPELSLLLTSREPLRISGEGLYRLGGISNFDRAGGLDPALQLFLHAARQREPDFDLSVEQIPVFQELCSRVSGSPLALRLMAQWVSFLSLEEILARVHADLDFLDGASNGESHHRTLREVFEESWRRLEESQRKSLAAMSIFDGPFDWKTANEALNTPLDAFAALEQRGLIEPAFGRRFSMHPLVRSYAREKLGAEPSVAEAVTAAHRAYFLGLLCSRMSTMATLGQVRAIDDVQANFADVKAAWLSALEAGDPAADVATEPLAYFANLCSMLRDAVDLFDESKTTNRATAEHLRALRACFFVMQGDSGRAQSYSNDVLHAMAAPKLATAHAHMALGNLSHAGGDFGTARHHYEQVLQIRRAENDRIGTVYVTFALASLHISFGDPAIARDLIKEAFVISREIGLTFGLVMCHLFAGELALNEDRLEDAHTNFVSGLELERSASTPQYRAQLLRRAGSLERKMGRYGDAEKHHAEALELLLDLGDQRAQAHAYIDLGEDSLGLENLGEARDRFLRGVRLATAFASDHLKNLALLGLARTENNLGNVENAARIANILADTEVAQKEAAYATLIDAIGPHLPEAPPCELEDVLTRIASDADARPLML